MTNNGHIGLTSFTANYYADFHPQSYTVGILESYTENTSQSSESQ